MRAGSSSMRSICTAYEATLLVRFDECFGPTPRIGVVGVSLAGRERDQPLTAALEEGRALAVERARRTRPPIATAAPTAVGTFGPRQRRAVRLGGIGGREHQHARPALVVDGALGAQPIDRARQRELRRAEPGDEPAPPGAPDSSSARSTGYTPAKPPAAPSARTASRVTTPCRSSSCSAAACARSVGVGSGSSSGTTSDQRPAPAGGPRPRQPARMRPGPRARRLAGGAPRDPQRPEGVVGDLTRPHEIPERGEHHRVVGGAGRGDEVGPEARARPQETVADRVVDLAVGRAFDRGTRRRAAAPGRGRTGARGRRRRRAGRRRSRRARPPRTARRACRGGSRRRVRAARRVRAPTRGWPLLGAVRATRRARRCRAGCGHALPRGEEARVGGCVDGLDLVAQRGERAAAQDAQHVRVAPLPLDTARPELAEHDPALALEPGERAGRVRRGCRSAPVSSSIVNGTCVRAKRATTSSSGRRRSR